MEWKKRNKIEGISSQKQIELRDFYSNQLQKVKFTRNSVVVIKSNSTRQKQINMPILSRPDSAIEKQHLKEEK